MPFSIDIEPLWGGEMVETSLKYAKTLKSVSSNLGWN